MKKVLSLLMSLMLLVTAFGTTAAASGLNLTYHITNELDYDEDYIVTVPSGTILTIVFEIENNDGEPYTLSSFQNEIYFDDTFFDYAQGETVMFDGTSCGLKEYSDGEQRVFVNTVTDTNLTTNQAVATFKLKVTETEVGASSIIETKSQLVNGTNPGIAEKNLTVVIGDTPPDTRKYDITYRDNDGSILYVDEDILNGQTTHLNSTITKDGYILDGWLINNTPYEPSSAIEVTGNIDAYAKWVSETPVTYSVSFNTNGGSFIQAVSGIAGSTIQITQSPTRSGYTFDGWYTNSGYTGTPITSIVLTDNTIIYAKWSKESTGGGGGDTTTKKNTITFKTADGIELDKVERASGTMVDLSKYKYEKDGYTFFGIYKDKELTEKVASIQLTEDIILYVRWIKGELPSITHPELLTTQHYAYIVGREPNKIFPQENITRAEVATIFFRLLTEEVRSANITKDNNFADVNEDEWFNVAVSTLAKLGIVNGKTKSSFDPRANITRAEFTTIAARFSNGVYRGENFFKDIDGHWAMEYINTSASLGWIVGENGIFRPNDNITRAEVMTLVNRVLNREPESKADLLTGMTTWKDNSNEDAWYYLAVQEATNSHTYDMKADGKHEKWTSLTENPDWSKLEN